MPRALLCLLTVLVVAGCGTPNPQVTFSRTPAPTPRPTPTPSLPPDVQRVDVLSSGVGTYQLITIPVAVIRSAAARTGITGLVVHFVPTSRGRPLTPLDSPALTLYPGETLPVTQICTDTCLNADAVTVTLVGGTWASIPGSALTAGHAAATCASSCRGHGQWDITASVGNPDLPLNTLVDMFAACFDAAGRIIGGGMRQVTWPQAGGSVALKVASILDAPPVTCQVGASAPL